MSAINELFGNISFGGGGFLSTIMIMIIGAVVLCGCGFGVYLIIVKKKKWNLKVEIKIPRNIKKVINKDGSFSTIGTINKEWGKGFYNAKQGVVYIKRKGKKAVPMKPFDIKRYLSTGNILTVIQIGIEDYRPILDESYIELVDSKTGEEGALINAVIDTSESKSWKNSFEREAKMAYSIRNWLSEHGALLAMGMVLLMNLVGFAIVISRMPK
ncbi:MAG: hypothetical protein WC758_08210 [Candidatus Woesearchaeota archaeon]|jgi:hypothetical protein